MKPIFSSLIFFSFIPSTAVAQITPDSSLGAENSVVESNGDRDTINGGAIRNANLFHSFQEFNIEALREAYFTNPSGIANIFSRVTGNNLSNIQGTLGVLGNANLFLINPNGILFGQNARLDVNGSFFATTADSVVFGNGVEFSAANPNQPPLLTIDIPIGLKFRDNPGDITNTQETLSVNSEATISLLGGNLAFEDADIVNPGGRVELGSVGGGLVNLVEVANGFTVDYSAVETFGDISLSGRSIISTSGEGGGDIQVAGKDISITGLSGFISNTSGAKPGGDINILATDSLEISGVENDDNFVSLISNRVLSSATADGGDINIETGNLRLGDRALIDTFVSGQGNAGNININARENVSLESQGNTSAIISRIGADAIGNGGDISIETSSLSLRNGASLNASTSGQGDAGNILINATDHISVIGNSDSVTLITTNIGSSAVGNAGNIELNSDSITLNNNAVLSTRNFFGLGNTGNIKLNSVSITLNNETRLLADNSGQGKAGNIEINSDSVTLNNGTILFTDNSGQGKAGNIEINSDSVTLNNETRLLANNSGQGKGGNVTINATDDVSFANDSTLFVTGGEGGSININATNLSITSGSKFFGGVDIDSGSAEAQSGDIVINLTEDLVIDGLDSESLTFITNTSFGEGNPGNIDINVRNITFQNGGTLSSFVTQAQENIKPGDISLNATGDIIFDGVGNSFNNDGEKFSILSGISNVIGENLSGSSGKINITAQNLTVTNGGAIQSQVSGITDSGDININVADSVQIDGFAEVFNKNQPGVSSSQISSIITEDGKGNAGTINIKAKNLALSRNGSIFADIQGEGNAGNININAEQITISEQGNTRLSPSQISSSSLTNTNKGNGGNILINTDSLLIRDGGSINASLSDGTGTGGDIIINARDIISVEGIAIVFGRKKQKNVEVASTIITDVNNAVGDGGDIEIATAKLVLNDDAFISSNVRNSTGNGGEINISATNSIEILGESYISADVRNSTGNGGEINISATNSIEIAGKSDISADVFSGSTGNGGNLTIKTGNLFVDQGSQISAVTLGNGDAGSLTIHATDSIELSGVDGGRSGFLANALEKDGNSGELKVFTQDLIISEGATINVGNFPSIEGLAEPGTGEAGNLIIEASNITLENGGRITAATQSPTGEGANIILNVSEDITLRDNSLISAQAFKEATGGNLDIKGRFIVAFPNQNNDIIASAENGQGGNIDITAEALFGIKEREATLGNETNDIDASSQFGLDGNIAVNIPTVNPASGLFALTQEVVDPAKLIAQNVCTQTANSEFINIGKGGLPRNPEYILAEETIEVGLVAPIGSSKTREQGSRGAGGGASVNKRKPPAQGWIWHEDGTVELVAYNPDRTGDQRNWDNKRSCQ